MITCKYCKNEHLIQSTTTHVVDFKTHLIIENVPCWKCKQCGEVVFSMSVIERLEDLIAAYEKISDKVSVIDYKQAA